MDDDYPRDGNCHEGSGCPMNGEYSKCDGGCRFNPSSILLDVHIKNLGQTDRETGSAVQRAAPQQKI